VAFVSLGEGIDCTTPAGKLQLHILAALAEFERDASRSVLSLVWRGFDPRASGWADRSEPSGGNARTCQGSYRSEKAANVPGRLTRNRPPLAVSENPLGIDPPDPLESSTFRGRCSALPCSINQMFVETRNGARNDDCHPPSHTSAVIDCPNR
jgi:hypothetical protein